MRDFATKERWKESLILGVKSPFWGKAKYLFLEVKVFFRGKNIFLGLTSYFKEEINYIFRIKAFIFRSKSLILGGNILFWGCYGR